MKLNYQTPDFALIRASRETIRQLAITHSADLYLKALGDELNDLYTAFISADQRVAQSITLSIMALETDELRENLQALATLKSSESNNKIQNAITLYSNASSQLMEQCTTQLSKLHAQLNASVFELRSASLTDNRFRLAELADSHVSLNQDFSAENAALSEMIDNEKVLNESITAFEKLTVIDRLKPLLKQLTELATGDSAKSQVDAIKAGVLVATTLLDELNEQIKYTDLLKARHALQTRIDQRQERVNMLQQRLNENAQNTRQLNDLLNINSHQQTYISETGKLVDALATFLEAVVPATSDDVVKSGERLIEHSQSLLIYLNVLQDRWMRG